MKKKALSSKQLSVNEEKTQCLKMLVIICLHFLGSTSWNDICLICPEKVLKNKSCNRQDPGP